MKPSAGSRLAGVLSAVGVLLVAQGPGEAQTPAQAVVTSLTLFAGSPKGLWRTKDWGATWVRAEGTGAPEEVGAALAVLALGSTVFLGGDGGLYKSEDFGQTWARIYRSSPVLAVCPSRYPQADPTVFVGTRSGLLKSSDGGHTFVPTPLTGTPVTHLEWPGPALVATTGRGVMVSEDGGATFRGPGSGLPDGDCISVALSSYFAADPVLFAGAGEHGVFRSADGARTWKSAGLPGVRARDLFWLGPWLFAATSGGLFRTQDGGATWSRLDGDLKGVTPGRILLPLAPDSGAEVFLGTDDGVFYSPDAGQNWRPSGLKGEAVLCLASFPAPDRKRRKAK